VWRSAPGCIDMVFILLRVVIAMQRTAVNEQGAIAGAVARCRAVNLVDGAACTGAAGDGEGGSWQVLQARDGLFAEQGVWPFVSPCGRRSWEIRRWLDPAARRLLQSRRLSRIQRDLENA
jgi:hypothetical protein